MGILDNKLLVWDGQLGLRVREDGVLKYVEKAYDMSGQLNHPTQTTEASQPRLKGIIAPNEKPALSNQNGESRYLTHPEISFAADEAWSVTTVLNWDGGLNSGDDSYYVGDSLVLSSIVLALNSSYSLRMYNSIGSPILFTFDTEQIIGKTSIISIVANGSGSISLYVNGEIYTTVTSVVSSMSFTTIGKGFYGKLPHHSIQSGALTPTQVTAEYNMLRALYPEIPSVQIGTEYVASSNFEAVASSNGTVITEAADNTDWATGAARWCYHSDDVDEGAVYGKLYNKAARDVIVANPPEGWHVATEAELTALALNGGNALKKDGTDYWNTTGGTNTTVFTALGGASRNADGTFNTIKDEGCFWCADSDKVMKVYHNSDTAEVISVTSVNEGFSIRLIKD